MRILVCLAEQLPVGFFPLLCPHWIHSSNDSSVLASAMPENTGFSLRGLKSVSWRQRTAGSPTVVTDVYLMICHHKTTIFTEAKETTTVYELKKVVEGILKRPPEERRLYKDDQLRDDDDRTLLDCGLSSQSCCPHVPAAVGLALFRPGNGTFEPLHIDPFSSTPELPDVTKSQESGRAPVSKPCIKTSIFWFASCRQGAGLVYVSSVHPHPSKCVYLLNKALQFNYMTSAYCGVQAANTTVSWDPSPKLVLEEKEGSSWLHVQLLNCKWHRLPSVFPPANTCSLISSELLGAFRGEEVSHRLPWCTSICFSVFTLIPDSSTSEEFGWNSRGTGMQKELLVLPVAKSLGRL